MIQTANQMAIYFLNKDKKYNLDNYLRSKWVSPFDCIRAAWYLLTIKTGYADTYRNEQFIPKSDIWYNHERLMLGLNLDNPDVLLSSSNLFTALSINL